MGIIATYSFLLTCLLSLIFIPPIRHLALHTPLFKKVKVDIKFGQRIPHLGGLAVFISFISVATFMALRYQVLGLELKGVLLGSLVMVAVGLFDDFMELSPIAKFFGQTLATTILVSCGVITRIAVLSDVANILLTYVWLLAMINAVNLLDIMDGLAAGVAVIAAGTFLALSLCYADLAALILCAALIGALLGFLVFNFPPAKIYLGDTGSMLCGFVLAAVAIVIDYAPLKREIALVTPVLVLGFPLFDTSFVVLMRLLHRRPIAKKSGDHFALRLRLAGWPQRKILLFMYIFAGLFAASALLISRVSNEQGLVILALVVLCCLMALRKMGAVKVNG